MEPGEKWIMFLEKNPKFYRLSKGGFFIKFLEAISSGTKSIAGLRKKFPEMGKARLQEVMQTFLEIGVLSEKKVLGKSFYTITPEGEKFLAEYRKTRKSFTL